MKYAFLLISILALSGCTGTEPANTNAVSKGEPVKAVCDLNSDLCGYEDSAGNLVITHQFERAKDFYRGSAIVFKQGSAFLIDRSGKKISAAYSDITGFSENDTITFAFEPAPADKNPGELRMCLLTVSGKQIGDFYTAVEKEECEQAFVAKVSGGDSLKQAILGANGKIVSEWYNSITARGCSFIAEKGGVSKEKRALLDMSGKVVSEWYDLLTAFELSGTFLTAKNTGSSFDNHGLVDKNGREVLPPKYNEIICKRKFILAYTTTRNIAHYTLFDTSGKALTDAPVIAIYDDNDLALVSGSDSYAFYHLANGELFEGF